VREYLEALGPAERNKVAFDIERLRRLGLALGEPYVKNLHGKLWELRTTGRHQHRVVYFATSGRRLVLLHAFAKKTAKTPRAEIETAMRRMNEYLEREG
jgi:phage-related protein